MRVRDILPWKGAESPAIRGDDSRQWPPGPAPQSLARIFEDFFDSGLSPWGGKAGQFVPTVDVVEKDREILVTAELPCLDETISRSPSMIGCSSSAGKSRRSARKRRMAITCWNARLAASSVIFRSPRLSTTTM